MKKVSFTEMKKGTKEDYLLLDKNEKDFAKKTADRILKFLSWFGIIWDLKKVPPNILSSSLISQRT